ncbi:virulence factor [Granulosicoccus sp. 3-233]|uniref:virulence factor n=1 Tax=Granulosicoccus sp. 3-233 TaxID=3417969 RepID=UPI003D33D1DD
MPELIRIYWRDIPSQVTAKAGRKSARVMLPARFQEAIDRAAMRAGKGSSDAYMEDWRRERSPCSADLQSEADAAASALVASFDEQTLEALTKVKGVAAHLGKSREEIRQMEQTTSATSDAPSSGSGN